MNCSVCARLSDLKLPAGTVHAEDKEAFPVFLIGSATNNEKTLQFLLSALAHSFSSVERRKCKKSLERRPLRLQFKAVELLKRADACRFFFFAFV